MKPVTIEVPISKLRPMDVKCSTTSCEQGFHFYTSKRIPAHGKIGDCPACGDDSVDWARIHRREQGDIQYTFNSLKKELLRHVCWVNDVDETAVEKALKRGRTTILQKATNLVTKRIAKIPTGHFDYQCTPKKGNEIVHYAQHATATCCRKCLERWHNIPQDIVLSSEDIKYCVSLIELYINERIPDLKDEPIIIEKV